ncbi:MAG: tryptophan-rich sensory protein [Spirochaetales bacterium]|nr:tryptophan-rich sensory protein [Spirochaetales bacterium]
MKNDPKLVVLSILNVVAFLAVITVNALANILPINGKSTGALSDSYPNLFVPVGFTFSIWGIIYLLLAAFAVYQLVVTLRGDAAAAFTGKIGFLFILSCAANAAWIFAWHYERVFLSLLCMLVLLLSLVLMYLRLEIGVAAISGKERFFFTLPFSVYLGWITVATVANVTALLVHLGWKGFGLSEVFWAAAVIIVAFIISLFMLANRSDTFYTLVVIWAFLGIFYKRITVDSPPVNAVALSAGICGVLLIILVLVRLLRRTA